MTPSNKAATNNAHAMHCSHMPQNRQTIHIAALNCVFDVQIVAAPMRTVACRVPCGVLLQTTGVAEACADVDDAYLALKRRTHFHRFALPQSPSNPISDLLCSLAHLQILHSLLDGSCCRSCHPRAPRQTTDGILVPPLANSPWNLRRKFLNHGSHDLRQLHQRLLDILLGVPLELLHIVPVELAPASPQLSETQSPAVSVGGDSPCCKDVALSSARGPVSRAARHFPPGMGARAWMGVQGFECRHILRLTDFYPSHVTE
jgi:hypothetical protein